MHSNALENLITDGFLRIKISDEAQGKIDAIFNAARSFFQEPPHRKTLNRLPEDMGYRPYGIEYSRSPSHPDQIESFSVCARLPLLNSRLRSGSAQVLYERMLGAFEVFESAAEAVTVELANKLSTDLAGGRLHGAFHNWSRLQLNYSRPSEARSQFINETHEDGDLMTVTFVSGPGLEVKKSDGGFAPITTDHCELLVMPGEVCWLLSGGQVQPLYHRVRANRRNSERMALIFFGDIDPNHCRPWISNEINRHVDIKERILSSVNRFGLKGFSDA